MRQHGIKQGRHVWTPLFASFAFFHGGPAIDARGVNNWKVQLLISSTKFVKQIKCSIDNKIWTRTWLVNLVHNQNWAQTQGQSFLGHKTSLWHGSFLRINQQHNAINHRQRTLDLTTEVGVAWGVHDIDVGALPADRAIFSQNGDATLALDSVVVHHGIHNFFVVCKCAGLAKQLVNHGCFAMVNVGNDGDITNRRCHENPRNLKNSNNQ